MAFTDEIIVRRCHKLRDKLVDKQNNITNQDNSFMFDIFIKKCGSEIAGNLLLMLCFW